MIGQHDLRTDLSDIRKNLGVCPQHDIVRGGAVKSILACCCCCHCCEHVIPLHVDSAVVDVFVSFFQI